MKTSRDGVGWTQGVESPAGEPHTDPDGGGHTGAYLLFRDKVSVFIPPAGGHVWFSELGGPALRRTRVVYKTRVSLSGESERKHV